jgi:hypothetical protein
MASFQVFTLVRLEMQFIGYVTTSRLVNEYAANDGNAFIEPALRPFEPLVTVH